MAQTIDHIVDPNDSSLTSEMVQFPGNAGNVSAYVSRPKDGKNLGTVIVIHENRGLVNHIKDVARHFAKDGFAAIAVDCMGRIGGSDKWNGSDEATKEIQKVTGDMVAEDLTAALNYMKKQNYVNGKVGVVGYCWGGGQSLNFATKCKDLNAAVVYYGTSPDTATLANVKAPVLGLYGSDDARVNATIESAVAEMKKLGKSYETEIYEGAGHGFLRAQSGREGANLRATEKAWPRTIEFFKKHLK